MPNNKTSNYRKGAATKPTITAKTRSPPVRGIFDAKNNSFVVLKNHEQNGPISREVTKNAKNDLSWLKPYNSETWKRPTTLLNREGAATKPTITVKTQRHRERHLLTAKTRSHRERQCHFHHQAASRPTSALRAPLKTVKHKTHNYRGDAESPRSGDLRREERHFIFKKPFSSAALRLCGQRFRLKQSTFPFLQHKDTATKPTITVETRRTTLRLSQ